MHRTPPELMSEAGVFPHGEPTEYGSKAADVLTSMAAKLGGKKVSRGSKPRPGKGDSRPTLVFVFPSADAAEEFAEEAMGVREVKETIQRIKQISLWLG